MKKIIVLLMASMLLLAMTACSSGNTDTGKDTSPANSTDTEKTADTAQTTDTAQTPEATQAPEKKLDSKYFGVWEVAAPEDGKTYVTIEINDKKNVTIDGNKYEYRLSAYSSDADPQLLVESGDGKGYQLSIYGSYEPVDMFFTDATFDDNGVHTGDDSVEYIQAK